VVSESSWINLLANSVRFEVLNSSDYEECYLLGFSPIDIYLLILKMVVLHGATSSKVYIHCFVHCGWYVLNFLEQKADIAEAFCHSLCGNAYRVLFWHYLCCKKF
jgi:hypothetical protein